MSNAEKIPAVVNNVKETRFEVALGKRVAYTRYRTVDHYLIFFHTEVPAAFKGKGVASAIVKEGFAFAAKNKMRIVALCPFVQAFVKRMPEYQNIVATHEEWQDYFNKRKNAP